MNNPQNNLIYFSHFLTCGVPLSPKIVFNRLILQVVVIIRLILNVEVIRSILLVVIIELSDFRCNFSDLPSLESIASVENDSMLLLKFPQLRVDVECAAEVSLNKYFKILVQTNEKQMTAIK